MLTCMKDPQGKMLREGDDIGETCVKLYEDLYTHVQLPELDFGVFDDIHDIPKLDSAMCNFCKRRQQGMR